MAAPHEDSLPDSSAAGPNAVKSPWSYRWLWIAAIAAALALRIFFVFTTDADDGDSQMYEELAHNWRTSGIYGMDLGHDLPTPVDVRVPGYPGFLAVVSRIFGDGLRPVLLVQVVVDLGTCVLVAMLAAWLVPPELRKRTALVAMWLAAVCPFVANYCAEALTEVLTTFWTAVALLALTAACVGGEHVNWRRASAAPVAKRPARNWFLSFLSNRWFLGGLAVGMGTLVRPETPLLLMALALLLIWRWRRAADWGKLLRAGALVAVGFVLPLIPWTARNAITLHEFQPFAARYAQLPSEYVPHGFMAWTGTWLVRYRDVYLTSWNLGDDQLQVSDLPASAFDSDQERARVQALYDDYDSHCCDYTPEWDAQFGELARERTARHPLRTYLEIPFERSFTLWLRPRIELSEYYGRFWPPLVQYRRDRVDFGVTVLFSAIGIFYVALAFAGAWRARARREDFTPAQRWAIAFLVVFCVVRTIYFTHVDTPEPRYMLECYPAVFALGAIFFAGLKKIAY
jgi:4-amino-4-deoxy-L-arabinose transferase-like glycosyltransferase